MLTSKKAPTGVLRKAKPTRRSKAATAVFALCFTGFAFFYLFPLIIGTYWSLTDILPDHEFVLFKHYKALFASPVFVTALINTVVFTVLALVFITVFSFGISYLLVFKQKGSLGKATLLALPIVIPSVAISAVWQMLFHHKGYFNGLVHLVGGQGNADILSGAWLYLPLLLLFLWKYAGFSILIYCMAFLKMPKEYVEIHRLEGGGSWSLMRRVLWPYLFPQVVFTLVLNLFFSANIFRETYAVWKDYPPRQLYMLQNYIFNNFQKLEYERALAASVILIALIAAFISLLFWIERRWWRQ